MPHVVDSMSSHRPSTNGELPGVQTESVAQGISAPIEKAWASPRAKIAQITNGVGNMQQTTAKNTALTKDPTVTAKPSATATTVTAISSHARLN